MITHTFECLPKRYGFKQVRQSDWQSKCWICVFSVNQSAIIAIAPRNFDIAVHLLRTVQPCPNLCFSDLPIRRCNSHGSKLGYRHTALFQHTNTVYSVSTLSPHVHNSLSNSLTKQNDVQLTSDKFPCNIQLEYMFKLEYLLNLTSKRNKCVVKCCVNVWISFFPSLSSWKSDLLLVAGTSAIGGSKASISGIVTRILR